MKKILALVFLSFGLFLNAQETATLETSTQNDLRCEIKEKYSNGTPKQSFYYDIKTDALTKVINYYESGKESTVHWVENNKKVKSLTYNKTRGFLEIEEHFEGDSQLCEIYYEEYYDDSQNKARSVPKNAYFYSKQNGKQQFKAHFKEGKLIQLELYNSKGIKINALHYNFGVLTGETFWFYGRAHGIVYSINKEGVRTPQGFEHKGVDAKEKDHPNWQDDIEEFDKIPKLKQEATIILKEYQLIQ